MTSFLLLMVGLGFGCDKSPPAKASPAAPAPAEQEAASDSPADGTVYGAALSDATTADVSTILANPDAYRGKRVKVEGMVTDVCPKRGCWLDVAGNEPGQKLRFKVNDGAMVFPMDAKGKRAVAEGVVAVRELSLEETKEYLEYQATYTGAEFDPDSVTEPATIVRLDGVGAVIR